MWKKLLALMGGPSEVRTATPVIKAIAPSVASNIVECVVNSDRTLRPPTLLELGTERILHRRIVGWTNYAGTYGPGGPGFFALELDPLKDRPREFLTLTLWAASQWLLLDGRWVEAHPNQHDTQKPLYSNYGAGPQWDYVSHVLVGSMIGEVTLQQNSCSFILVQEHRTHRLELPQNAELLPRFGGDLTQRAWYEHERVGSAWVICTGELWCG